MDNFTTIHFSYYDSKIDNAKPLGIVNLRQFLDAIKNPKPKYLDIYDKIKEADLSGNEALKATLKQSLYSFTPATLCEERRKYANIKSFSGLLVLDYDKFSDGSRAEYFKTQISDYKEFPYIIATWLSASGRGVRVLIDIPVVNTVDDYKELFFGIYHYTELGKVKGFDKSPQNPVLPLFMSYDKHIYINEYPKTWTKKYVEPKAIYTPPPVIDYSKEVDVRNIIEKSLSHITDVGHPILRATAFTVGGYVGGGYISEYDAIQLMDWAINNHSYLKKKASVYQKTARTMIKKGIMQPINK